MKKIIKLIFLFSIFLAGFNQLNADDLIYSNYQIYGKTTEDNLNGTGFLASPYQVDYGNAEFSLDGNYIYYSTLLNNSGEGGIYKIPYTNTQTQSLSGTKITGTDGQPYALKINPIDGNELFYSNSSDGGKLYKKNLNDGNTSSGVRLGDRAMYWFDTDGTNLFYANEFDNWCLYKTTLSNMGTGTKITSQTSYGFSLSPDGLTIIYRGGDNKMYETLTNGELWNGNVMTTDNIENAPVYTNNMLEIIYVNASNGNKLYKKSALDNSNGVAINSINSQYPEILRINTPPTPTPTPEPIGGIGCIKKTFYSWDPAHYLIGNGIYFSNYSTGSSFKFGWLYNGNSHMDRFSVYPFYEGTLINSDTFTGGINANINTTFEMGGIGQTRTSITINLSRSGASAGVNYVRVKTNEEGDSNNKIANVDFILKDGTKKTYPMTWTGGVATAFSNEYMANSVKITWLQDLTINGFEIGTTLGAPTIKYNCKDYQYDCVWVEMTPGDFYCKIKQNLLWFDFHCHIDGNSCTPFPGVWGSGTAGIIPPTPNIELLYKYGSGYSETGAVIGINLTTEDIFACIDKETGEPVTGLDVLGCPFIIISNIWGKFTSFSSTLINMLYNFSNIGSPTGTGGDIFGFLFNTANAGGIELSVPFDLTSSGGTQILKDDISYTGTELAGFNRGFYDAMDNVKNMDNTGIKGILSFSIWFLILVVLVAVISMFLMSLSSKKTSNSINKF